MNEGHHTPNICPDGLPPRAPVARVRDATSERSASWPGRRPSRRGEGATCIIIVCSFLGRMWGVMCRCFAADAMT